MRELTGGIARNVLALHHFSKPKSATSNQYP